MSRTKSNGTGGNQPDTSPRVAVTRAKSSPASSAAAKSLPEKKATKKSGWGWFGNAEPPTEGNGGDFKAKSKTPQTTEQAVPQQPVFQEINLETLSIHSQKKEFQGELESLQNRYRGAIEGGNLKLQAEIKLKIDTLQGIVDEMVLYRKPPAVLEGHEYTFWLMDRLKQTMKPSGGYITETIYVPQAVWLLEQGKLVRYHLKMDICNQLLKHLIEIESDFIFHAERIERLVEGLKTLNGALEEMHGIMAFQLAEIKDVKDDGQKRKSALGSFGAAIAKGTAQLRNYALPTKLTMEESQAYITILTAIFEKTKFLRDLSKTYSCHPDIRSLVDTVLDFLKEVVCAFVLHDVKKLIQQYHDVSARAFLS